MMEARQKVDSEPSMGLIIPLRGPMQNGFMNHPMGYLVRLAQRRSAEMSTTAFVVFMSERNLPEIPKFWDDTSVSLHQLPRNHR